MKNKIILLIAGTALVTLSFSLIGNASHDIVKQTKGEKPAIAVPAGGLVSER